ncbi:hypothetical protein CRENBAI_010621, partial [Crenichthys baileyi]
FILLVLVLVLVVFRFIRDRVAGAADSAETPRGPSPQHLLQLLRGEPKAFPGPAERKRPFSACPGPSPGPSSRWEVPGTSPKEGAQEASGIDARAPPQLAPLDVEEKGQLYSEPPPNGRGPSPHL